MREKSGQTRAGEKQQSFMIAGHQQSWTKRPSKHTRNQGERGNQGEGGRGGQARTRRGEGRGGGMTSGKEFIHTQPKKYNVGFKKKKKTHNIVLTISENYLIL